MPDLNDLLAKLPEIRARAKCAAYYEQCDIPGTENLDQASKDLDSLLELVDRQAATIDRLLNDHEPHIAALEKRLAEIEGLRLVVDDKPVLPMRWWHLPEFGPIMAVDTEDQRDNSYGPFATREEAQADWLKVISGPPPSESDGAA